jgi:hypothetical protein
LESPNFAFKEGIVPWLRHLLQKYPVELTLLSHVHSPLEESQIKDLFFKSGLYELGLDPRRVLFCDSEEGLYHMIRHLEPSIHLDSDHGRLENLKAFVPRRVWISPRGTGSDDSALVVQTSLSLKDATFLDSLFSS